MDGETCSVSQNLWMGLDDNKETEEMLPLLKISGVQNINLEGEIKRGV